MKGARIWDQYELEHPETRRLPAVMPLVVHHDRSRWTSFLQLLELIDLGLADKQAMQRWLPRCGFLLDDLTCADEDQLLARDLTPPAMVTLLLLKNALDTLNGWFRHAFKVAKASDLFEK